ncbi:protein kinase [Candidatus Woesearchaeota archaeon]|nr:protein kinase [Candidatus Woesearchaeota archaeon]MBW3006486.1 protein kinase [Candidatus Woesearchaeota archaeon]
MVAWSVSKLEKAFVNYVLDAGLLDKEEIRRICIAKKRITSQGKEVHLAQLAVNANYLTREQAQGILKEVKREIKETDPKEYEESINGTLDFYGIDLEQILLEQKLDFSKPENRYVPIKEMGRGAMGVVEKVWDNVLLREVARKTILLPETAQDDESKQKEVIRRTQRAKNEARLTGKLSHPFIMKVHDSGRDADNNYFYVMELVENGKELADVIDEIADIKRKNKMQPDRFAIDSVLEMIAQVCDAMDYSHKKGIIHRDLKPANIMVYGSASRLFMYVVDWGLAKDVERREFVLPEEISDEDLKTKLKTAMKGKSQEIRTQDGQVMGTLKYMAPEQALGAEKTDEKSDIFSLGAILYEVLTGQTARDLQGKNVFQMLDTIAHDEIEDARNVKDPLYNITPGLAAICAKAMHIEPKKRYKTAGHMAKDIRNYLEHKELIAKPDGFFEKWYKKAIRNPLKAGMAVTAAILLPLALGGVGVVRGISAQNELRLEKDKTVAERVAKKEAQERAKAEAEAKDKAQEAAKSEKARADAEAKAADNLEDKLEAERDLRELSEKKRKAMQLNLEGVQRAQYALNIVDPEKKRQTIEEAIALYRQAIEFDSTLAQVYNNLAVSYRHLGKTEEALENFDRAIELDPKLGKAYHARGTTRALSGDLSGAIADYEKAKALMPLYVNIYTNLSVCYMRDNNFQKAVAVCDEALRISPQNALVHRNKGESLMYLGRYRQAEQSLSAATVHGEYDAHLILADNLVRAAQSGNPLYENWRERAKEHCARAVKIDPRLAEEAKGILEKIR